MDVRGRTLLKVRGTSSPLAGLSGCHETSEPHPSPEEFQERDSLLIVELVRKILPLGHYGFRERQRWTGRVPIRPAPRRISSAHSDLGTGKTRIRARQKYGQ
jgi:hypothetical protein